MNQSSKQLSSAFPNSSGSLIAALLFMFTVIVNWNATKNLFPHIGHKNTDPMWVLKSTEVLFCIPCLTNSKVKLLLLFSHLFKKYESSPSYASSTVPKARGAMVRNNGHGPWLHGAYSPFVETDANNIMSWYRYILLLWKKALWKVGDSIRKESELAGRINSFPRKGLHTETWRLGESEIGRVQEGWGKRMF